MVQEHISLADCGQEAAGFAERGGYGGQKRRILEVRTFKCIQFAKPRHTDRTIIGIDQVRWELKISGQDLTDRIWCRCIQFQSNGRCEIPLIELFFHGFDQIRCFVLLDGDFRISRHAEWIGGNHLQAGKQIAQVICDDLIQPNKSLDLPHLTQPHLLQSDIFHRGKRNESGKGVRHFDSGKAITTFRVLDQHRKIEAQIGDMRERMGWIKGQRREYGRDLTLEVLSYRPLLLRA